MDSNKKESILDSQKLLEDLGRHIEDMEHTLTDDEEFCSKEIDSTNRFIEIIEKKFNQKIQELKMKLNDIRLMNKTQSENNRIEFNHDFERINDLFTSQKYNEAEQLMTDCRNRFKLRKQCIHDVPKIHVKESDIDKLFSGDYEVNKRTIEQTNATVQMSTIPKIDDNYDKSDEKTPLTRKQEMRRTKTIETINVKNYDETVESSKKEENQNDSEMSTFGSLSKQLANQSSTSTKPIAVEDKAPVKTDDKPIRKFQFSTRLASIYNGQSDFDSNRSSSSLVKTNKNIPNNQGNQTRTVQTLQTISDSNDRKLILNPVSHYQHDRTMFVLMTCNVRHIVCFKRKLQRLDTWQLGAVERGNHSEYPLPWHDGLIISMGFNANNDIFMFTERELFLYSIIRRNKIDRRILPRGDDEQELSYTHRGIGAADDKHIYHIYLNRSCHWSLTKYIVNEDLSSLGDRDLTLLFPHVQYFINLCVNNERIYFLVQFDDGPYGIVFCSTNDFRTNEDIQGIQLPNAKKPLTICSAFIKCLNQYIIFVNDPSINTLHILSTEKYLLSYPVECYAMSYVANKNELIILTNNSISSIDLNKSDSFFSQFLLRYISDV